ncbi:MAG: rod shape-determining protein RodA [Bacteroidetes bacterium]|nr:rod shape-determining protein RodA [Bacteroidota bacterium]MBS1931637.1 rod shape-determining protein RodA [Bacteroidota bacterium]
MSTRNPEISKGIDWSLVWIYLVLVAVGIAAIFAATYKDGDPVIRSFLQYKTDYSKQFYFFIIAAVLAFFVLLTDSKFFTATANLWYVFGIFVLLLVFPFHSRIKGTESIIRLGGFQFQPAEFCKICVALALAKYISRPETDFSKPRSQFIAAFIALFPALLTIFQSETGLALVYFSFFLVMFREGLPPVILVVGFAIAVLVVATIVIEPNILAIILTVIALLTIYFLRRTLKRNRGILLVIILLWFVCVGIQRFAVPFIFKHVLQKYQVERIYDLFGKDNPYHKAGETVDLETKKKANGSSYNVKQSKIAIGSGQLWGKGFLKGTQTRYDFVPEQRTDFIFCTIGEGFGFTGSVLLLAIYLLLLFRIITIAERQRSVFSRCYAYGVAAVFFFHIVINVAMTVGLAPVIGIPLPLISYGGTSLLTFTVMLFILIRLDADRQMVLR